MAREHQHVLQGTAYDDSKQIVVICPKASTAVNRNVCLDAVSYDLCLRLCLMLCRILHRCPAWFAQSC